MVSVGLLAAAAPAVAAPNPRVKQFCTAALADKSGNPYSLEKSTAQVRANSARTLAKLAPTKTVKKDLKTIAALLRSIASGAIVPPTDHDALASLPRFQRYAVAAGRITVYVLTACAPSG